MPSPAPSISPSIPLVYFQPRMAAPPVSGPAVVSFLVFVTAGLLLWTIDHCCRAFFFQQKEIANEEKKHLSQLTPSKRNVTAMRTTKPRMDTAVSILLSKYCSESNCGLERWKRWKEEQHELKARRSQNLELQMGHGHVAKQQQVKMICYGVEEEKGGDFWSCL